MTAQQGASHFGQKLRAAREGRGLTLRQIADATKISMMSLEALERNDIARLPGGIFSRAFVRSYAIEVGLDPESTIEEFVAQIPSENAPISRPTPKMIEDHVAVEGDQRMASTFLRLILISVPVAAIVIYFAMFGRRTAGSETPAVQTIEKSSASATDIVHPAIVEPDAAPAVADASAVAPVDRLVVLLKATQRCWVSAVVDGQRTVQRTFLPGDETTLDVSRELVLTAGDPSALTMTINGTAARPLGPGGQQATAHLTPANFRDYLPTP